MSRVLLQAIGIIDCPNLLIIIPTGILAKAIRRLILRII